MRQWLTHVSLCLLAATLLVGVSEGAGSLTVTFKDNNGAGLAYAYAYLRSTAKQPPMEKYASPPDLILGPSGSTGTITAGNIPAGTYFLRLTRRNPIGGATRFLGPPEPGDHTWFTAAPITITDGQTTNLGTKVAAAFGSAQTSISGTVTHAVTGVPLPNRYIRVQIGYCIEGSYPTYYAEEPDPSQWTETNMCNGRSAGKQLAFQRTDASGKYTVFLREPGTYYIYETTCLGDQAQEYTGNPCIGYGTGPVTVSAGEQKTVNFTGY